MARAESGTVDGMAGCDHYIGVFDTTPVDFFSSDLSNFADHVEAVSAALASPRFPGQYEAPLMISRLKAYTLAVDLGEFPRTSMGLYPRYGILYDGTPLCPKCCRQEISSIMVADNSDGWLLVDADVNYEDLALYCANCNDLIPAAYGDDPEA